MLPANFNNTTAVPGAILTDNGMTGTKRKSAPAKDGHTKESKKPKIDTGLDLSSRSNKSKPKQAKIVKESSESDSDSDVSNSDGGALLHNENPNVLEEESDSEPTPKIADGLHPDRAKAVVTNSKLKCHLL